jgi:hypothetical protein
MRNLQATNHDFDAAFDKMETYFATIDAVCEFGSIIKRQGASEFTVNVTSFNSHVFTQCCYILSEILSVDDLDAITFEVIPLREQGIDMMKVTFTICL